MSKQEENKALVLEALDAAFNKRTDSAFECYWSPNYIQHSSHIGPGRDGLRNIVASYPPDLKYENGLIMAAGDYVMVHGRYSNTGRSQAIIVVNIFRIENGLLAENWDVIQDEVSEADSKSGLIMFDRSLGKY